jgi:nitronate monooxygenase
LAHDRHRAALVSSDGDSTVRTRTPDIARALAWPPGFTARVRRNAFTDRWDGHEDELAQAGIGDAYRQAWLAGDPDNTGVFFGEAAGLIDSIEPAGEIVARMTTEAAAILGRDQPREVGPATSVATALQDPEALR